MHRPLTVRTKLPDRRILCVDELCPKPAYLDADKVLQHLETVHSCPVKEEPVFEALLNKTKTGEAKCEAVQQVIIDNFRDPLVAYLNGKLDIPFVGGDQEPRNGSECRVGLRSRLRDPPDGCLLLCTPPTPSFPGVPHAPLGDGLAGVDPGVPAAATSTSHSARNLDEDALAALWAPMRQHLISVIPDDIIEAAQRPGAWQASVDEFAEQLLGVSAGLPAVASKWVQENAKNEAEVVHCEASRLCARRELHVWRTLPAEEKKTWECIARRNMDAFLEARAEGIEAKYPRSAYFEWAHSRFVLREAASSGQN